MDQSENALARSIKALISELANIWKHLTRFSKAMSIIYEHTDYDVSILFILPYGSYKYDTTEQKSDLCSLEPLSK